MLRRLLTLIVLLVVVVGAAIGGTILFMSRTAANGDPSSAHTQADKTSTPPAPAPAPIFAELDSFTVTLYGETRNRILYTTLALRLGDADTKKQIEEYMPEVRDRVLKVLSAQSLTAIQTGEGRQALSGDIRATLSKPYGKQLPAPHITDVLFTAFVVQ